MTSSAKKPLITICILICLCTAVSADPLRTWNHDFNPSLLAVSSRETLDIGLSVDALASNSALGIDEIFKKEIVIDLNKISDDLNGGSLLLTADMFTEVHVVLTLFGISLGFYAGADGIVSLGIPGEFIDLIANGNAVSGTTSGSETVYGRLFYTAGLFAGYRWNDFQFGAKLGVFGPLFCTDPGANFNYSLTTNVVTGEITGTAQMNVPFYSSINFNEADPNEIFQGMNGFNISIGAVKVKDNKAMWGASISGITLKVAEARYKTLLYSDAEISIDNIAGNIDSDAASLLTQELSDFTFETLGDGNYTVSTPLQAGGFYRLSGFPGFIDWIAHGELTFDDEVQLRLGVTAEGSIPALSWLSIGLEYNRINWNAVLGLRANLHYFEIGMNLGLTAPELKHLFNANGVYGKIFIGMGF